MASLGKIIEGFPHPTIKPIVGKPEYEAICNLHRKLNVNAASAQTTLGGGDNAYMDIMLEPTSYTTFTVNAFINTVDPFPIPTIPATVTTAQTGSIERQHNEQIRLFNKYNNVCKTIKQMLIASVEYKYFFHYNTLYLVILM